MKFNKYTTYEFDIKIPASDGEGSYSDKGVQYKIDNNNEENSVMVVTDKVTLEKMEIPVSLLKKLNEAMREVDPFSDFSNIEE